MENLREQLKALLHTEQLTAIGGGGGGCISNGTAYRTDEGTEVFVKVNNQPDVSALMEGAMLPRLVILKAKAAAIPALKLEMLDRN